MKNIHIVYIISTLDLFAVGLTLPLFLPHLRALGASHSIVGVFSATYSAIQVLSGPVIGSWSDLKGRKFALVNTLALSSVIYFLLGVFKPLYLLFLARVALGCVKHTQTLCKAVIADIFPKSQHAEVFGRSAAFSSLGFVIGPIIGGHLSETSHGYFYACCIAALTFLLNIGLVLTIDIPTVQGDKKCDKETVFSIRNISGDFLNAVRDLFRIDWKVYLDSFALRFLFGLATSIFFSQQSLYIRETYSISQKYVGYIISFLSAIGSVCGLLLGKLTKKYYTSDTNCLNRLMHAYTLMSFCFIGLYVAPNVFTYVLMLMPFAVSSTILRIVSMENILATCTTNDRGSLSGASNSIMSVARFVSPIASGLMSDMFGGNTFILLAFCSSVTGIVLSYKLHSQSRSTKND